MATKAKGTPVSEADVIIFDEYVAKWQKLLNLVDWRIERGGERSKNMAEVSFNMKARLATYRVGEHFGSAPVTRHTLEETAVHELLHVTLYPLTVNAVDDERTESLEHGVINVLCQLLMQAYGDKPEHVGAA